MTFSDRLSAKPFTLGAAAEAIIAGVGTMIGGAAWIIAAIPAAVCFGVAVKHFGEGVQHAANAVPPDSALRFAVEDLETRQPDTHIRDAESDGRLPVRIPDSRRP